MIGPAFARLSTGIKMLLILSAALLPLGLIALMASIESAQTQQLDREAQARVMASESALQLTSVISRLSGALRRSASALPRGVGERDRCMALLQELALTQRIPLRLGLFDERGGTICTTERLTRAPVTAPLNAAGTEVRLIAPGEALRFSIHASQGIVGVGELTPATLTQITRPQVAKGSYRLVLRQGDAALPLANQRVESALGEAVDVSAPVAGGQMALELTLVSLPLTAIGLLLGLLPIMMWLAAALIGWFVVDRLVIRPLGQMQRTISTYRVEDGPLQLPVLTTPSQEIRSLGSAFQEVTNQLAAHDAELEEGLARQRRLTREVHHRVKNNLQVVSSLINIHSRGSTSPEAGAAYASIQRRVDALAVVHRNHYAELEENRGVGLRSLIGELAANLRATAAPEASHLSISLDVAPLFASQDVAVPIAFLITELVELVMTCAPSSHIAIRLEKLEPADRALLTVTASALASEACMQHPSTSRFNRVIEGLARQLRAGLRRDDQVGQYAIEISIVPEGLTVAE